LSRRKNPYARPDHRTLAARSQGYAARSVFKLEEIDKRVRLFRAGQHVLDLGAAPGSWTQYAAQRVGANGRVLAVDLVEIAGSLPANVSVLQGDALALENTAMGSYAPYDVVLSDMAPNTSGSKVRDQARSFELFERALGVALSLGKPRSGFVGKLFMSEDFNAARQSLAKNYAEVRVIRPEGTRQQSSELFLVGLGRRTSE
jgi:23S rRNA (uridine2552-2'-O)-methyltransferase